MILGLILLFLIMIIGGDRGVISLIALVGNMLLLSLAIWLMAAGAPVLLVTIGMGIIISCVTLFYQNGTNEKTKSAFAAVLITMTVLFFFIYMVVWRSETGGLNEIQAAEDDVLYYNMNLDINMRNVATAVIILSTLGAVLDLVQKARVKEVMCAYNRFEGEPCCGSNRLLMQILRDEWGYKGIVW